MNVYKHCPTYENDEFILCPVSDSDKSDLLKVYGDIKSVPFFNSDNCHGDDFHYTTPERMQQALDFWKQAYDNGWFVRRAIVCKATGAAIGTVEEFLRTADDHFTECDLLRIDLRSDYERRDAIKSILALIIPTARDMFGCKKIATKAAPAAAERIKALSECGFVGSEHKLIGFDGTEYSDYYEKYLA